MPNDVVLAQAARRGRPFLLYTLIIVISFAAGWWMSQMFPGTSPFLKRSPQGGQLDQSVVQQASRIVQANYYDSNVTGRQLTQGSVNGMVGSLNDSFSQYLTPEQYRSLQDSLAGRHTGAIGISIDFQNGYPVVAGVLPNSPALHQGVQTDDVILQVNGEDTYGLTAGQTSALLRGANGSKVRLLLGRPTTRTELTITREQFQSPTVESIRLPNDVLYLRVYQFGSETEKEFDSQLAVGLAGARGAVLDLRDNGGGQVSAAVAMVSRFVDNGVVLEERGRTGRSNRVLVDGHHPAAGLPLVVLVNHNSASSSEIVAGSLQAHRRSELVGSKTFGKGSVQVAYALGDGSAINLTVQQWTLPDGRSINGTGLNPDETIALPGPSSMFDVVQPSRGYSGDTQLQRALQILSGS